MCCGKCNHLWIRLSRFLSVWTRCKLLKFSGQRTQRVLPGLALLCAEFKSLPHVAMSTRRASAGRFVQPTVSSSQQTLHPGKAKGAVLALFFCTSPLLTSWLRTWTFWPWTRGLHCLVNLPLRWNTSWVSGKRQHSLTSCEWPFLNNAEQALDSNPPWALMSMLTGWAFLSLATGCMDQQCLSLNALWVY